MQPSIGPTERYRIPRDHVQAVGSNENDQTLYNLHLSFRVLLICSVITVSLYHLPALTPAGGQAHPKSLVERKRDESGRQKPWKAMVLLLRLTEVSAGIGKHPRFSNSTF